MPKPDPHGDGLARTKLRRIVRTNVRRLRPVVIVLQVVYYVVRVVHELTD